MMDFGKVKEAIDAAESAMMLVGIEPRDCDVFENGLGAIEYLRLFIAELEKPAVHGPIYVPDAWEKEVDRISESYHAKKCAECWRVPRVMCSMCGDPITVGVCENCVPDMFNGDRHFHSSDVGEFRKKLNSDIDEIIKNNPEAPRA